MNWWKMWISTDLQISEIELEGYAKWGTNGLDGMESKDRWMESKESTTDLEASCSTPFMVAVMYVLRAMN